MERRRRTSPQTAAVLLALAEQGDAWSHGYDLCGRLDIKAGTMYPILMRLADRGHVETTWEKDAPRGRPPRHLYRLSAAGSELVTDLTAKPSTAALDRATRFARSPRPTTGMAGT